MTNYWIIFIPAPKTKIIDYITSYKNFIPNKDIMFCTETDSLIFLHH